MIKIIKKSALLVVFVGLFFGAIIRPMKIDSCSTPLMLASLEGNVSDVQWYIQQKVDVNQVDASGWTALMYASCRGHVEVVKILIKSQANVHAINKQKATALMLALQEGYTDVAQLLLDSGAQLHTVLPNNQLTPLIFALKNDRVNVVQWLIQKKVELNKTDEHGLTALMVAVLKNNMNVVKELIGAGADLNAIDKTGCTALILAVPKYKDAAYVLIDHGANPNCVAQIGREKVTALFLAHKVNDQNLIEKISTCLSAMPLDVINEVDKPFIEQKKLEQEKLAKNSEQETQEETKKVEVNSFIPKEQLSYTRRRNIALAIGSTVVLAGLAYFAYSYFVKRSV